MLLLLATVLTALPARAVAGIGVVTANEDLADPSAGAGGDPLVWGLSAMGILLGLLALTWAFRSVGKRH